MIASDDSILLGTLGTLKIRVHLIDYLIFAYMREHPRVVFFDLYATLAIAFHLKSDHQQTND